MVILFIIIGRLEIVAFYGRIINSFCVCTGWPKN